jgi:hypothetical protein
MNNFNVRYTYSKPSSHAKSTTSLQVKAETEEVAYRLAENQAKSKHPGYEVFIIEIKRR